MTGRDRIVLVIVACVVAVAGSWLLVIEPKRSEASKLGAQITQAQSQLSTAQSQVAAGQAARSSYSRYYTELARLGEAVPADDNVPSLIVQIQHAADLSGVDFRNLVLSSSAGIPSAAATLTGAPAPTLPPGVTVGPANLPIEPFTFTFNGNFFRLAAFFGRLERFVTANNNHISVSGRLMTVNAINFGPGPKGFPQITATINATTYLVPASEGLLAGATPAGPAAQPVSSTTQTSGAPAAASSTGTAVPSAAVTSPVR